MDLRATTAIRSLETLACKGFRQNPKSGACCASRKNNEPFLLSKPIAGPPQTRSAQENQNADLPPVLPRKKKKPFVTPLQRGGFQLKEAPRKLLEDPAFPPGNGMLVHDLVPVAHAVVEAREALLQLVATLIEVVPVKVCMYCAGSHIGPIGHEIATCKGPGSDSRHSRHVWATGGVHDVISNIDAYHSYDRFHLIKHEERFKFERLPALVELCIQAGVDLPEYPTRRRTAPVRMSGRKIVEADELYYVLPEELDFLKDFGEDNVGMQLNDTMLLREGIDGCSYAHTAADDKFILDRGYDRAFTHSSHLQRTSLEAKEIKEIAIEALKLWEVMRSGAEKLMTKYTVKACGYCPEVHIGPRGHKARLCGEYKHQWRQGQHGWQVASLDDLILPKYVWHVPDPKSPLLLNEMRRFYGQVPAIVELCVQAGAEAPSKYRPMMRVDVIAPTAYEAHNAV